MNSLTRWHGLGRLRWLPLATLMFATAVCKSEPPSPAERGSQASSGVGSSANTAASGQGGLPSPPLPSDPEAKVVRFDNGVTYVSRAVATDLDRVALALVVKVGSLVERDDARGLAHFVEHMGFRGTAHFPERELMQFLDRAGVGFGADANASTTYATTRYVLELPANDAAMLERGVAMLADFAAGMVFDGAAVDKERNVVLAEVREKRGHATMQLQERLRERWLMRGTRYAERSVAGLESVVAGATAEQLAGFYRRWYQPQNFIVLANGRLDAPALQRSVERHFAALPKAAAPVAVPRFAVSARNGTAPASPAIVVEANPELPASAVTVHLQRPVDGFTSEADYRQRLLDRLVAELLGQRVRSLPEQEGSGLLGANVSYAPGDVGMYDTLELTARPEGELASALAPLLTELERVQRHGFTPVELTAAAAAVKQDWVKSADARTGLKAYALSIGQRMAQGEATPGMSQEAALHVRLLAGITPDDVSRHGAAWARDAERYLLIIGRDAAALPSEAAVRQVAADVSRALVPPAAKEPPIALRAAPPPGGAILSLQRIDALGVSVWQLSNGARVVFKPLPLERRVGLRAVSPGGSQGLQGRALVNARLADSVVAQLGLGDNDGATTARLLAAADVQLSLRIGEFSEGARASAPPQSLEPLLTAVYLGMAAPRWDARAFELQRRRVRDVAQNIVADPFQFFSFEVERQLFSEHPRHTPLDASAVDQLDLDSVRAFYTGRFGDAGDFTFVIAGNTTEAALEPLVARYLASLPGTPRADGARTADVQRRAGITRVRVRRGVGHPARVRLAYYGNEPLAAGAWRELDALRAYLELRLREVLREQLAGVYLVNVWMALSEPPQGGYELGIGFDAPPERSTELRDAALVVIDELRKKGADPRHLEALAQMRARALEASTPRAEFWLEALSDAYRSGGDPSRVIAERTDTTRLSSDALRAAARRYLRDEQHLDARLEPEPPAPAPR